MSPTARFTLGFYFKTLTGILTEPRKFFSDLPKEISLKYSLGFLLVSSLVFAGAGTVSNLCPRSLLMGGIFFINAVGMALIAAGFGYMVMAVTMGNRVPFIRFFSIYAFASGVTLLASWLPFFTWLTEPWKWWLIGTGMVNHCGIKRTQAVVIIVVSFVILCLFFWALLPVVSSLSMIFHQPN